jgi:peroxiredoxin
MSRIQRWVGLLGMLICAVGIAAETTTKAAPDDMKAVDPGHSMHGQAFNEGPRQRARRMSGMPEIHFEITTTDEAARAFFLQGVGQLHGFWYLEAERSFRESAFHDTNCAMAYWGMAMANINNPKRAGEFIREADLRKTNVTHREKLWIGALGQFYKDPKRDEKERRREYTRALENIIFEFPEDVEAKAFLAFHLWDSHYKGWPIGSAQAVESLLKEIFAAQAMHPAHHYRIHLWDGEKDESAIRAVPSASKSGQSSPGVAHQWHMAGHTFNKLKRYPDMAWQQEASVRVDNTQLMVDRVMPDQIHNYAHNSEWLVQTYNYNGQVTRALELSKNMVEMPRHPNFNTFDKRTNGLPYDKRGTAMQGRRRLMETLLRWELWEETLRLGETLYLEPTVFAEEQGRRARLLGLAHLGLGEMDAAQSQMKAIEESMGRLREERQGHVDTAEAAAKAEKKGRGDVEKAMAEALKRTSEPLENLENYLAELKVVADLKAGETNGMVKRIEELKTVSKERLAGWWLQVGETNKALTAAREAVEGGTNQLHPLAVQTEVFWKLGQTNEALKTFGLLRERSAWAEISLPVFRRLEPVVVAAGLSNDWRVAPSYPADSGNRPPLESLGSFRWDPQPAPGLELPGMDGKPVRLSDYRGRPVLVVFYLGHRCVHCMEQLQALAPRAGDFRSAGIEILAVSTDSVEGLGKALQSAGPTGQFPFPLVADPDRSAFKAWHAHDDFEGTALHGLFLVDGDGLVRWQDIGYEPFTDFHFLLPESKRLLGIGRRG